MAHIQPTPDRLEAFQKLPAEGPIWMLNLLRFVPGGADTYERYGAAVGPMIAARGGRLLFRSRGHATVIGPEDERWDEVLLVMYPSRDAFFDMIGSAEYQAIAHLRSDALEDSRLVFTTELPMPTP